MQFKDKHVKKTGFSRENFLSLKDGESAYVIFAGEPQEFFVRRTEKRLERCDEDDAGASFRFRINVIVKDMLGTYIAKIFESGKRSYRTLSELNKEYNGLENTVVKITRRGQEKQTEYQFLPAKQSPSPETLSMLAKVKLLDLTEGSKKKSEDEDLMAFDKATLPDIDDAPMPIAEDEIPF